MRSRGTFCRFLDFRYLRLVRVDCGNKICQLLLAEFILAKSQREPLLGERWHPHSWLKSP